MIKSESYNEKRLSALGVVVVVLFVLILFFWLKSYSGGFEFHGQLLTSSGDKAAGETVFYDYEYKSNPFAKGVVRSASGSVVANQNGEFEIHIQENYLVGVSLEVLDKTRHYKRYSASFSPEGSWSQGSNSAPVEILLGAE